MTIEGLLCCIKICSMRASPKPSKMSKSLSFRGLHPLHPPGALILDPTPLNATLAPLTGQCLFLLNCPANDFGMATHLSIKLKE